MHPPRLVEVPDQDANPGAVGAADKTPRCKGPVRKHHRRSNRLGSTDGQQRPGEVNTERNSRVRLANSSERWQIESGELCVVFAFRANG